MGIIIDSREQAKFRNILKAKGLEHTSEQMMTGDVRVFNDTDPDIQVLIERKRLDDLISSYYGTRMNEQFARMSEEKFAVLIITGNLEDVLKKIPFRVMSQVVEEVIADAIIKYNFRSVVWLIDKVADVHHSGFVTMVKCIEKVVMGQLDVIPEKKNKLAKDLRINTLKQLFGLDTPTCRNLLIKHGTVNQILKLTDDELLKVKGLGPAKIKTIRFILNESFNRGNFEEKKVKQKCSKCGNEMSIVKMPSGNTYICKPCTFGSI